MRRVIAAAAVASVASFGSTASAAVFDLGFILDKSGSMNEQDYRDSVGALATALAANVPVGTTDTYRIGVYAFNANASPLVAPVAINNQGDLDSVVNALNAVANTPSGTNLTSGLTNYQDALLDLHAGFIAKFTTLGDNSLINFMTDGNPTTCNTNPDCTDPNLTQTQRNTASAAAASATANFIQSQTDWDSLSFEIVDGTNTSIVSQMAFDTSGDFLPGGTSITDPAAINDPLNQTFVIVLDDQDIAGGYSAAVQKKIQKIVDPDPIPLPGSLVLMAGGLGLFGFVARRKKQQAA